MDSRTIFSKTGKGSLEITKKALKLSGDERQALILVDGKSSLADIEQKLSRINPIKLRSIFDQLLAYDLIREFVTRGGPDSIAPPGSTIAGIGVQEITEDDLDFTALAPVASGNAAREIEERRKAAEDAERRNREESAARDKARLAEEARRKNDAERARVAEEAARKQAEEQKARLAEEARRKAEAERQAREEAERRTRAEAEKKAREEAERKAREEAERKAREEAERKAREEAERKAREEAERKAREEAERKAREEAERKAREEAERRAREEAERRAREEAERKAREEAERKAREEAERRAREEAERKAREEAERKAREDAERRAREEAERRAREEAERKAREEAERKAREEAEQRAKAEARERARQQEEAIRRDIAERQAREEAQRRAVEEAQRRAAEEAQRRQRELAEEESRRAAAAAAVAAAQAATEEQRRAEEEAARYTAALTPHLEDAARGTDDPQTLAPMGAFSNLAALESGTQQEADDLAAQLQEAPSPAPDAKSLKDREKEAKERAKAEEKARKEAEKEARRLARQSAGPSRFGIGKIIAATVLATIVGGVAYIFSVSADKPEIERQLSARFGTGVTVGEAKFTPFPAELRLRDVQIGDIRVPSVVAVAEPSSLASNDKIWKSVDVAGLELSPAQLRKLADFATRDAARASVSFSLQRLRATGVAIVGTPVAVPKFDATLAIAPNGRVKQATLALPDGKAQVLLAPEEKGWQVDVESRGVAWPLGPKLAWESLRGKGIATADGLRLEEFTFTLGGGVGRGNGDLAWSDGWKFNGQVELSGVDVDAIGGALYGGSPISGPYEGKLSIAMSAASLPRLFDAPQMAGDFVISRAVFKSIDFARLLQGGDPAGGQTRLPEVTGSLAASAGRLQLRNLRGTSGLVTLSGAVDVLPDKSLTGQVNVELGASGSRGRGALRVGGTLAEPRFGR